MQKNNKLVYLDTRGDINPRRQLFFKELQEFGFSISALLWDRSCTLPSDEIQRGVTVTRVGIKADYTDISAIKHLLKIFQRFFREVSNVHCDVIQAGHLCLLPLALWLGRSKKAVVIYDVSEFYMLDFFRRLPKWLSWAKLFGDFLEDLFASKASGIICVPSMNDFCAKRYRRLNKDVQVILNVPEKSNTYSNPQKCISLKQKYQGRPIIIYIGGIFKERGAITLVESINILKKTFPDILLMFVGEPVGDSIIQLNQKIEKYGLKENIIFLGHVPYKDIQAYLNLANVAVCLNYPTAEYSELTIGNNRKICDYMAAGLPLVVSDVGETGRMLYVKECGIIVDPTDPRSVANGIKVLLSDPGVSRQMGANARKAVCEKYNWEMEKIKLIQFYRTILEDGPIETRYGEKLQ